MTPYEFLWSAGPTMPNIWATAEALKDRADVFAPAGLLQYFDGETVTAYGRSTDLEHYRTHDGLKFLNPDSLAAYQASYARETADWWTWIRQVEDTDYDAASVDRVKTDHATFQRFMRDAIAYFGSTRTEFTFAAEQELLRLLENHDAVNSAEAFQLLTTSLRADAVQREEQDWSKLGPTAGDSALLAHASVYPWLVFGQFDEAGVVAFLRSRATFTPTHTGKRLTASLQEEQLKELGSDADRAEYLARLLQTQAYERMEIKAYWAGCYYLARGLWKRIAAELALPLSEAISFVTPQEIQTALTEQTTLTLDLSARKGAYAVEYIPGGDVRLFVGDLARARKLQLIPPETHLAQELTGQSASRGQYTGRVRKVRPGNLEELQASIAAFQPGEVLVTSMTQPNMMVIARKAGAIVADEGGITSHAAVIARELGVPCIVGCKQAMQTFTDGEEIEVDADHGIVRKK